MVPTPASHVSQAGVDYLRLFGELPVPLLVIRATDLMILDANPAFTRVSGRTLAQLVGRTVVDGFPDRAVQPGRDQEVRDLLHAAVHDGVPRRVERMRWDLPGADGPVRRHWTISELPIPALGSDSPELVLQITEDTTDLVLADELSERRLRDVEAGARRLASLADTALLLSSSTTLQDLVESVIVRGASVVGTAGGMILTPSGEGDWQMTFSATIEPSVAGAYGRLPHDSPLPACHVARTGRSLLLPTQASGLAFHPATAPVYAIRPHWGWAFFPLASTDQVLGSLAVCWDHEHEVSLEELELLEAMAAQCAQALHRLQAIASERRTAHRVAELARTLQAAMLTEPPRPAGLELQARYRPAVDFAQVGGDWYDAVELPDGSVMLAIGDVCGHDHLAAATMGQMRVLLRSLAYGHPQQGDDAPYSPAAVLARFEELAVGLGVDSLATAVLARLEPAVAGRPGRRLTWSNAGNLPPTVIAASGSVRFLDQPADLLLGVFPGTDRHDHVVDLDPGDTLLLFTDGLVERRDASLSEGLAALDATLAQLGGRTLAQMCDGTLERMVGLTGEDDIALLGVRVTTAG